MTCLVLSSKNLTKNSFQMKEKETSFKVIFNNLEYFCPFVFFNSNITCNFNKIQLTDKWLVYVMGLLQLIAFAYWSVPNKHAQYYKDKCSWCLPFTTKVGILASCNVEINWIILLSLKNIISYYLSVSFIMLEQK